MTFEAIAFVEFEQALAVRARLDVPIARTADTTTFRGPVDARAAMEDREERNLATSGADGKGRPAQRLHYEIVTRRANSAPLQATNGPPDRYLSHINDH